MSNEAKYLTLVPGTQLKLGDKQTLILPTDYSEVLVGETVELENEQGEKLGTAIIQFIKVTEYAQLQHHNFLWSAHPELVSWHQTADHFRSIYDGFSITDQTSVIGVNVLSLSQPGLTVRVAEPTTETEPTPTVEEATAQFLEEVAQ
jgi:hypothetical protein